MKEGGYEGKGRGGREGVREGREKGEKKNGLMIEKAFDVNKSLARYGFSGHQG